MSEKISVSKITTVKFDTVTPDYGILMSLAITRNGENDTADFELTAYASDIGLRKRSTVSLPIRIIGQIAESLSSRLDEVSSCYFGNVLNGSNYVYARSANSAKEITLRDCKSTFSYDGKDTNEDLTMTIRISCAMAKKLAREIGKLIR